MDVDGVMTDGAIVYLEEKSELKTFDARDGVGLWIARRAGLRTGLISGRSSAAAARRAAELGMEEIHLKTRDKLATYVRILRRSDLADSQVCYIGDDLVDLQVLRRAGMPVAPSDAHPEVLSRVPFITRAAGGHGAIREVIDAILKAQGRWREVVGWFDPGPAARGRAARRDGGRART
ncbi:MAG: HAD hydrolase family protein [Acidobacteria bacterium]|nr:HAD hydrolase family protein [Acidobacteriota bacterium]